MGINIDSDRSILAGQVDTLARFGFAIRKSRFLKLFRANYG